MAAQARTELARHGVHGIAAVRVLEREHLIATLFEVGVQLPENHRTMHLVERGVAHARIVDEARALLDSAQESARDAETEHDHRLRAGEDVARIVLLRRALPS